MDSSRTSSGAGGNWSTAFRTLNEALAAVYAGSPSTSYNLYVTKGTYYPTGVQSGTDRDSSFVIRRGGIRLYGGYPSGGGIQNANLYPTRLSGNIGNAALETDNSNHILTIVNVPVAGDSVIVDGFYLEENHTTGRAFKNYNGTRVFHFQGGAAYVINTSPKVLLKSCVFRNGYTGNSGAGLYVEDGSLTLENCTFTRNVAGLWGKGGAIYNDNRNGGVLRIHGCSFENNRATVGGAVFTHAPMESLQVSNTSFTSNGARCDSLSTLGAALYYDSAALSRNYTLENLTFTGNTGCWGAAVYVSASPVSTPDSLTLRFRNCQFLNNKSLDGGGAGGGTVALKQPIKAAFDTCTFVGNRTGVWGGAIYAKADLQLRGCLFRNDTSMNNGGAIYIDNWGSVVAENTHFIGNVATWGNGGAICSNGDSVVLLNCVLDSNQAADGNGGAVYLYGWAAAMNKTLLRGNYASGNGGAVYFSVYEFKNSNSLISGNAAASTGGAGYISANNSYFEGTTMAGNYAPAYPGIDFYFSSAVKIKNSIFWDSLHVSHPFYLGIFDIQNATVKGGFSGPGNLASDPLFLNPAPAGSAPTAAGNYALSACSPAIEAGQNTSTYPGQTDLAGNPRLSGLTIDQGAYEFQGIPITGTLSGIANDTLCAGSSGLLTPSIPGGTWTNPLPTLITITSSGLATAGMVAGTDTLVYTVMSNGCPVSVKRVLRVLTLPQVDTIAGSNTVCKGSTIQLNNASIGGVWESTHPPRATVSATGLVTGLTAGTVTIRYKLTTAGGCMDSVSHLITVLPRPAVLPITGAAAHVCVNDTLQLANATSGGAWSVASCANKLSVTGAGVVTGLAPGLCNALYTVIDTNGCVTTRSYGITIYPAAAIPVVSGPSELCAGTAFTYVATPGNGIWSHANSAVASLNASTGQLNPLGKGTDTLFYQYVNGNGCKGNAGYPVAIDVDTTTSHMATLCGPAGVCIFNGRLLTDTGNYSAVFTSASGCDSTVNLHLMRRAGSVSIDTTVNQINGQLTAQATGMRFHYQWVRCELDGSFTVLPNDTLQTLSAATTGAYAVAVADGTCAVRSGCHFFDSTTLNTGFIATDNWEVFPVPASDWVRVRSGNQVIKSLSLLDATGKALKEIFPELAEVTIPLRDLASGLYLLRMQTISGQNKAVPITIVR